MITGACLTGATCSGVEEQPANAMALPKRINGFSLLDFTMHRYNEENNAGILLSAVPKLNEFQPK
ncbi:hypothetical protein [Rheinheimera sp.]|uniref:hypothetical protein n=1 Tax=Rheinheimera sp. TaxID=1869214 RepID=UPI00261D43F6|nr:hypothetical protein [Rheinheimera sp.]MCA1929240.1 hypothetical protein [Rheinheimera sp.]